MSEPTAGTAVVQHRRPFEERIAEGLEGLKDSQALLDLYRARSDLSRRQLEREAASQLAKEQAWGKNLSDVALLALARWCLEKGLDPARHIFLLGGRVYDNAEYYRDKLAADPRYLGHEEIVIAPLANVTEYTKGLELPEGDLARLKKEIDAVNRERLSLAVKWAVPPEIFQYPKTAAAVLVLVRLNDRPNPVEGVNWAGSRGRTKGNQGGAYDPVGDQEPIKTARTRAFRVAAKEVISFTFKRTGDGVDDALVRVEDLIHQGREALKRGEAEVAGSRLEERGARFRAADPALGSEKAPGAVVVQPGLTIQSGTGKGRPQVVGDPYDGSGELRYAKPLDQLETEKVPAKPSKQEPKPAVDDEEAEIRREERAAIEREERV